ncbi:MULTISPECIES: quinone oxidoreductase family protein [Chryseobacterium]|uniref:NADPH:quinone reductase-like Zn-dependent oxidoreductase n=1 Tax=Chryseobacterium camelliae TaxID=1265445 RepID=A0ABU0TMI7_9FLAO|nr:MULTISPECIES: zinc-binding alcohol dehydrogenase family protein [Chryseobacterium]MDT3407886.1 NADPH:quinone reductase-like Zn-dependent oxidoreductase [Pseudacidovorax intermedius]MDQ1098259.1 NADPH:quinone reductase-like Zn-dependent oxidoreductase [Chryseobacterium camelliae]MDQ1102185.1 NADPH:quinone reductase-like Zn-dependent oxidoreductase [Chryseobacterium sp. SORGH_AS_1048]MDR6085623.1 NADPH:quinone reductase-like Zn-dependent oxidoreductase [Chryseobacterium sp. SORGH_AS_0909]MDR6
MKAAVVFRKGEIPQYAEFPDPVVKNDHESLITVKAASIKHLDRARASGKHYSTENIDQKPAIIGSDGAGLLEDGSRVYFFSKEGTVAELSVADKKMTVPIPDGLDFPTAAALPNAVMGSAMGFRFKAGLQEGETVLINGATGVTGKVAVQISKLLGAKKVIATGRNESALQSLSALGADSIVSLTTSDEEFKRNISDIHAETPIDIVLDYLWGHSVENILSALKGDGRFSHPTRLVSVGGMRGDTLQLSSQILRGTDIHISGSGLGSWSKEEMNLLISEVIPQMFTAAVDGKLSIETETIALEHIEDAWKKDIAGRKRLVVLIG